MGRSTHDVLVSHGIVVDVDDENSLIHYGKSGMKWGKRKAKREEKHAAAKAEAAKPKVKDMSDTELKDRINRLKLEKEYKTLTAPEISQGRKIVGKILLDVGQEVGKEYVKGQAKRLLFEGGAKGLLKATAKAAAKEAAPALARQVVTLAPKHIF
jgi:hypothetical protein